MSMKLGRIIAIGGGEIGRPGTEIETEVIDKYIIATAEKPRPALLFLPTASNDNSGYSDVVRSYFGSRLGCAVRVLNLISDNPTPEVIRNEIENSDIIYVGGGNTQLLMQTWKSSGIIPLLKEALEKGKTLSGVSAGAVCWFKYAFSDYKSFSKPESKTYTRLECTSIIPYDLIISPHQIREPDRLSQLKQDIKKKGGVGIAIDDFAALEIVGDSFRVIRARAGVTARRVTRRGEQIEVTQLP